jgi:hypothetical protein
MAEIAPNPATEKNIANNKLRGHPPKIIEKLGWVSMNFLMAAAKHK